MSFQMKACTYFIQPISGGPIKIGKTKGNPYNRLRGLQVSHHEKLQMLGWIESDVESKIHSLFERHRIRGEWFAECEEIICFVKKDCVFTPDIKEMPGWYNAYSAIHRFGERRGITRDKVARWVRNGCESIDGGIVLLETKRIANDIATTEDEARRFKSLAVWHTCATYYGRRDYKNCKACNLKVSS